MPAIGDITTRDLLGLRGRSKMIWAACPTCGVRRWTLLSVHRRKDGAVECRSCVGRRTQIIGARAKKPKQSANQRGAGSRTWKGGRRTHKSGYVYILLTEDDPLRAAMGARDGYVFEHRVVMARAMGRPLRPTEYVHHKNGDKLDNRLANLELWVRMQPTGVRASDYHCPGCRCEGQH